mgnify:CR=1 FL=1
MGTGKSRAAKILADGFDWQLADTDRMMERETGMRIADYYRAAGAEAFEEKEMALINRVRYYHEAVIAMGGNYPMTEKKFRLLSEHGLVILLFAKPYRLAERVRRRVGKRPTMDYSDVDVTFGRCSANGQNGKTASISSSTRQIPIPSRPHSSWPDTLTAIMWNL